MEVFFGSIALYNNFKSIVLICINKISTTSLVFNNDKLSAKILVSEQSLQGRQGRQKGGGQRGQNTWGQTGLGARLVWGPKILIKHLVIVLLSRGLGAHNA